MNNPEKIIEDLKRAQRLVWDTKEQHCNIMDNDDALTVRYAIHGALELLEAQKPVEPKVAHDGWYRCGNCNNSLASGERVNHFYGYPWPKYCEECGRKVKWNERLYAKKS